MANPSVTYTFSNGTTADATQVNQNFTDLINGLTDGTKSLTVDAITATGSVSFEGNVTLGNGTPDDISFLGSLATSVPIKTNNSFDIGSATLGLAGVYLGASGGFTTRLKSAATASWTLSFPATAGSAGLNMKNAGSGATSWANPGPTAIENIGLAASVGTNALTISLKGSDGNDPSSTNPVYITFRNATAATGTPVTRTVTAAVSMTVTAGAEIGHASGRDQYVWVYAIDNAGTVELAVSGVKPFDDGSIASTSGVGTGSDDGATLYSTTTRSNVAIRLIGRMKSNQAAAGTWATAISEITLDPRPVPTDTEWASYTPTIVGMGTATNVAFQWRKKGPNVEIRGNFTAGKISGSTATISNPSGVTSAGSSLIPSIMLAGTMVHAAANTQNSYVLIQASATVMNLSTQSSGDGGLNTATGTRFFSSTAYSVLASFPVVGWSIFGPSP